MRRSLDGPAAAFVVGLVVLAALLTAVGVVVAVVRGDDVRETVGWSPAAGGALVAVLVGLSGSTSVNRHESREVVGTGHFIGARVPLPQTSIVRGLIGAVCAGIGIASLVV